MQRVRIRYAKRGRLRFTSHRDIGRAFERAVRRSAIPVAYTSGFNPHPRLSYAGAAPTGVASEAEYLEIALAGRCSAPTVMAALDAALPAGLDVVDAVTAHPGGFADRLQASSWRVEVPGVPVDALRVAVTRLLAEDSVEVSRVTKRGLRTFDVRRAVVSLTIGAEHEGPSPACAILHMVVRHGDPSVRPDDVLAGLRETGGLDASAAPVVQRLEQGPLDPRDGTVGDPLAPDRDTQHA